ncbi:MAG: 3-hydroxybutyryl-CoA dehydrogenase [Deltaproteobacteria bacterium]|nr:MAG: 3-hydroxybutyryl-CoA dehydrogenase [Deltaproteobacteria bacterium]
MDIKKVGVVGAGQMGHGIAQVFAVSGFDVILRDINDNFVSKGYERIAKNLDRSVEKGRMEAADRDAAMARITKTIEISDLADCDLVVEAATENPEIKLQIFRDLDAAVKEGAILSTNTSSISITKIAAVTSRPELVIGMHFMNPVPVMKLVEIINGLQTSEETYALIEETTKKLSKVPVKAFDSPGFVANRILLPMINEAVYCLYEGVASAADIDNVMKLGMAHPMGPLALADLIGLDVCLSIMEVLHDGFADSKYRPCPLLRQMVEAGYLGQKTGKGFFDYK